MALKLKEKQAIVVEIGAVARDAHAVVTAQYRGLNVAQMTQLRRQARDSGVYLRVVRNTLARRALENTKFACLIDTLMGPLVLAFSQKEPASAARLLRSFAKEHKQICVHSLAFDEELLPASDLDKLADLPTKEEAIARLITVLNAVPSGFVRTLTALPAQFVRTITTLSEVATE